MGWYSYILYIRIKEYENPNLLTKFIQIHDISSPYHYFAEILG